MTNRGYKTATIKTLVASVDELGGVLESWAGQSTILAEIQPLTGDMTRGEMGVTEKSTHKLFTPGAVESNTRITQDGKTYLIGYVADWSSHREAVLEHLPGVV